MSDAEVRAELGDAEVRAALAAAEPLATGIGGSTARIRVRGRDVFVKRLPLTAIEEDDPTSTVDWFHLPVACHYGIGSPGFGVGRQIAAHQLTSDWVRGGATPHFPLLHGWWVLDQPCRTDLTEFDGAAPRRRWGAGWSAVRERVDAIRSARRSVVLLLEYVPTTLDEWLREQFATEEGAAALAAAIEQIGTATAWMAAHGLQHLDIHPQNILVRGGRLLFTDFGLALHEDFAMDAAERAFFATHGGYDRDAGIASLLHWVLVECGVGSRARRLQVLQAAVADRHTVALDPVRARIAGGADFVAQHAAVGVSMTVLFDELMADATAATYGDGQ